MQFTVFNRTMAKVGYQKVANKKDLPEGGLFKVEPQDSHIVLSMVNGKVYAMDAICSHEGGPLEEGSLDGYNLTCPWHYAIFDVRNAKVSDQTVWATDLNSYQVEVDEESGDIYVNLEAGRSRFHDDNIGRLLHINRENPRRAADIF